MVGLWIVDVVFDGALGGRRRLRGRIVEQRIGEGDERMAVVVPGVGFGVVGHGAGCCCLRRLWRRDRGEYGSEVVGYERQVRYLLGEVVCELLGFLWRGEGQRQGWESFFAREEAEEN